MFYAGKVFFSRRVWEKKNCVTGVSPKLKVERPREVREKNTWKNEKTWITREGGSLRGEHRKKRKEMRLAR